MLAVGMTITLVAISLQPLSTGPAMVIVLMCLTAAGQSVAWPNVSAMISETAHADRQGQILGLNNATGAMARVIGPLCAGLAFAGISHDGPFILAAVIVAPSIWLALSAARRARDWKARQPTP